VKIEPHPPLISVKQESRLKCQGCVRSRNFALTDYTPDNFIGMPALTLSVEGKDFAAGATDVLYLPDVEGAGQRGTLRLVAKIIEAEPRKLAAFILDRGTMIVDNIRVTEGGPGVWRRDFEGGIVLVNPSPDPIRVSQAEVRGTRNRTGIRRIRGIQVPEWNNGQAVTDGIEIPSGDGIVLLADRIPAAPAELVRGVRAAAAQGGMEVAWDRVQQGYVAGYLVRYGEDPQSRTLEAAVTRHHGSFVASDLAPGSQYYFEVAAYDYRGRLGPFSGVVTATTAGQAIQGRPVLASLSEPGLTPGAEATVAGTGFSSGAGSSSEGPPPLSIEGTAVLVNGVPVPVRSVSPTRAVFIVPANIRGERAILHVYGNGILSREMSVPVRVPGVTAQASRAARGTPPRH